MSRKIATLWDNKNSDDADNQDHSHREGQAFYAGGSEHSGQQILGPSRDGMDSNRLIEDLFTHARHSGAALGESSAAAAASGTTTLPITLWRNGFTVGEEGELRDYETPENRQFLECLKRGETPAELERRVRGGMTDVKLENKASQDYKPERKFQAFSGTGHRLGAPSPQ